MRALTSGGSEDDKGDLPGLIERATVAVLPIRRNWALSVVMRYQPGEDGPTIRPWATGEWIIDQWKTVCDRSVAVLVIGGFYHDFASISVVEAEAGEICPRRLRANRRGQCTSRCQRTGTNAQM